MFTANLDSAPNAFMIESDHAAPVAHALSLDALQSSVGGYIEPAFTVASPTRSGVAVTGYVNEEGILLGLPVTVLLSRRPFARGQQAHGTPLCGPMLICGLDERTGETVGLDASELEWIADRLTLLVAYGADGVTRAVHGLSVADLPA